MTRPPISNAERSAMRRAIALANIALGLGEVPVGAVVLRHDHQISEAHNETIAKNDLTRHAELTAIRTAMNVLDVDRLNDVTLCVTLEPCAQCAGAIVLARVGRVIFGAYDTKAGMAGSVEDLLRHPKLNHRPEVMGGVMAADCGTVLSEFFARRR